MWKQSHKTATYPERKSILTIGRRLTAPASVEKKKTVRKKGNWKRRRLHQKDSGTV